MCLFFSEQQILHLLSSTTRKCYLFLKTCQDYKFYLPEKTAMARTTNCVVFLKKKKSRAYYNQGFAPESKYLLVTTPLKSKSKSHLVVRLLSLRGRCICECQCWAFPYIYTMRSSVVAKSAKSSNHCHVVTAGYYLFPSPATTKDKDYRLMATKT